MKCNALSLALLVVLLGCIASTFAQSDNGAAASEKRSPLLNLVDGLLSRRRTEENKTSSLVAEDVSRAQSLVTGSHEQQKHDMKSVNVEPEENELISEKDSATVVESPRELQVLIGGKKNKNKKGRQHDPLSRLPHLSWSVLFNTCFLSL